MKKIFIILSFLIISNFLVSLVTFRLDLSTGRAYTLSRSTKKIISKLKTPVNITLFVSSNLPARFLPLKTEVIDLLHEYAGKKSKVQLIIADPTKDQKIANQAKEAGIPQLQFSQLDQNKYAVTASYFGLLITYADKKESLAQVTDVASLEYNITSTIYRLSKNELDRVGIIGGTSNNQLFEQVLASQFTLTPIVLSGTEPTMIDESSKALLIFGTPGKEYSDDDVSSVGDYIAKNGSAIFFVDGVGVNDSLTVQESNSSLLTLLKDYGVVVVKDLILSSNAELVNFGRGQESFFVPYPYWLKTNVLNPQSPYMTNVRQLLFPWVSSLQLQKKEGYETKELVRTTKRSWEEKDNFSLNPQAIKPPRPSDLHDFVIAAESKSEKKGRVVVIPSSRFALDQYQGQTSDNIGFVLNILNELASGGALTGIRSRSVNFYPLPELPENEKNLFKYSVMLALPLLFAGYGAIRLMRRK